VDNADIDIRVCKQTSVHAGLAVWSDPNDALESTVFTPGIGPAETLGVDGGGAPAAALVISAEDIGGLPGAPDTRGHAHWGIFIGPHDFSRNIHDAFHPVQTNGLNRVAWVESCDKTRFRAAFISDSCHIVLV